MKKWILLCLCLLCLMACQNKDSYLDKFEFFIEKLEDKSGDFTSEDWGGADEEFAELSKQAEEYREKFSIEEKLKIAKFQATYVAIKAKAGMEKLEKHLENAGDKVKDVMKK